MRRAAAILAPLLLLAGCLAPTPPTPGPPTGAALDAASCADLAQRAPSANAPLAAALRLPPHELAERLAAALGDELRSEGRVTDNVVNDREPTLRFDAARGIVEYFPPDEGAFQLVRYWGTEHFTPMHGRDAKADFERVLAEVGVPESARGDIRVRAESGRLDGGAEPFFRDEPVHGAGVPQDLGASFWQNEHTEAVGGYRMQVSIAPSFDLANATAALSVPEAKRLAEIAVACAFGIDGDAAQSVTGFGVANETLAHTVPVSYNVEPGCHGMRMRVAWIDAVSGAALTIGDEGAGCVE